MAGYHKLFVCGKSTVKLPKETSTRPTHPFEIKLSLTDMRYSLHFPNYRIHKLLQISESSPISIKTVKKKEIQI